MLAGLGFRPTGPPTSQPGRSAQTREFPQAGETRRVNYLPAGGGTTVDALATFAHFACDFVESRCLQLHDDDGLNEYLLVESRSSGNSHRGFPFRSDRKIVQVPSTVAAQETQETAFWSSQCIGYRKYQRPIVITFPVLHG